MVGKTAVPWARLRASRDELGRGWEVGKRIRLFSFC